MKLAILIAALTVVTGASDELAILESLPEAERLYVQNRLQAEARAAVSGYGRSPYNIEWTRYEEDAPYPEIVNSVTHAAFEVDDLERELQAKKVIIEPNSPSPGVTVAFIDDNGAPVEFLQIDPDSAA